MIFLNHKFWFTSQICVLKHVCIIHIMYVKIVYGDSNMEAYITLCKADGQWA